MNQDNHISYLRELNKELARDLIHNDYLLTQAKSLISKQQKAFNLLIEIQKVIAVAKSNLEFLEAIPKLINANLKMSATYIYKVADDSEKEYHIATYHQAKKRQDESAEHDVIFSNSDFPNHCGYLLYNGQTPDNDIKNVLQKRYNLTSMVLCPVYYNENIELVIVAGSEGFDGILQLDIDDEDARAIEAVGILISSYIRKVELIKLHETDKIKTEFLSNLSHEFRTPLTLVMGLLEDIRKNSTEKMTDKDLGSFEVVQKNALRIQQLIDQLLDISKLETNTEILSVSITDLSEMFTRISKSFSALAQRKRIIFQYTFSGTSEATWFDEDKLEKIVSNLLSNAFKFTPKDGRVDLSVRAYTESGKLMGLISVKDNGPGIPLVYQDHIFERFYQVKNTSMGKSEGTGVGLYLVKKLSELHYGTIQLKSREGEGAEFTVTLPIDRASFTDEELLTIQKVYETEEKPIETSDSNFLNRKIVSGDSDLKSHVLIVEDNRDLNSFIAANLSERFQILTAYNGKQGYEMAVTHIPDLIVSDVMMPEMDGVEMSRKVKENDKTRHIPIILLTAKADKKSKIEGLEAGVDDYITKPFDMEELSIKIKNQIETSIQLRNKFQREILTAPNDSDLDSPDDNLVRSVISLMKDNVGNADFYVDDLCEELLISKAQLYRKLDALTGYKPGELMRIIRIKSAAAFFQNGYTNVAQVMYQVGFSNQSNFAKIFKKQFNLNPSDYIRQHSANQSS